MGLKHIPDGQDFSFDTAFGFTGSARGNVNARNHPVDPSGDEAPDTYVERARGGRVHKARGGDITQETLAAPGQSFSQAFAAGRKVALAGGPKTFSWNGKSYGTDLAPDSGPSTGRAHQQAPQAQRFSGPAPRPAAADAAYREPHGDDAPLPVPPVPPDYHAPSNRAPLDFSNYSNDREQTLQANRELDRLRAEQGAGGDGGDGTYVADKARGGRVHKAMGGAMMGGTPNGIPGTPPQPVGGGPMSNATISMPVGDATRVARGMLNAGRAVGANQAVSALANAARMRQGQRGGAPAAVASPVAAPRPMTTPGVPTMAEGGRLSAAQRKAMPSGEFALPGGRYPINDANHARNALARVSQNGSESEQAKVRGAVHRKYPGIGKK